MRRVVVLGRGGAGKSVAARRLGALTGLPLIELDAEFWTPALEPLPPQRWARKQQQLASHDEWIMDGDLGPYDVLAPRLVRADLIMIMDYSLPRCAWRAARRSRERLDFWWWVISWRRRHRPVLQAAIRRCAPTTELVVLRRPSDLEAFLRRIVPPTADSEDGRFRHPRALGKPIEP